MDPRTVPELFDAVAASIGDREAFVDGDRRLSFAGWWEASQGVARLFDGHGVGKGDVVCLLIPSSIDYAVCYLAAMLLGAVTSGINPRLGPTEIASIVERTDPAVVVVGDGPDPGSALGPGPGGNRSRPPRPLSVDEVRAAAADLARGGGTARVRAAHPDDPIAVVWTSGTTGVPKGAVYTHAAVRAVAEATGDLSAEGDRRLSPLPFAHVGYMTRPWDEIARGITTVIVPTPWTPASALSLIASERVTVAQGVPAQWRLMLADPGFDATDFSSLRVAGTGASAVAPELVRTLRTRLGCPIVVGYASTETAVIAKSAIGDADEDVAFTVGRAAAGVEIRIAGPDGGDVPVGGVGTVCVRSPAAMTGYWRDSSLTASAMSGDGWIATGDLGRIDERGFLTLQGRTTEMYIRGGYNVYPVEVESVLAAHPRVAAAAVVGAPDPVLGEVGVAFVVEGTAAADGVPGPEPGELRAWCSAHLAGYKAPDVVEFLPALPLTPMSKVDKSALAPRAAELAATRKVR